MNHVFCACFSRHVLIHTVIHHNMLFQINVSNKDTYIPSNPSSAFIPVQKLTMKLNAMLSNLELSTIITWMPHGLSWMILKPKKIASTVMP